MSNVSVYRNIQFKLSKPYIKYKIGNLLPTYWKSRGMFQYAYTNILYIHYVYMFNVYIMLELFYVEKHTKYII